MKPRTRRRPPSAPPVCCDGAQRCGYSHRVRLVGMRHVRVRLDPWDAVLVGYATLAALCRALTIAAAVAVTLPGIALVAVAARRQSPPRAVLPLRQVAPWVGLVVAVAAWEAAATLGGNDAAHPQPQPAARPGAGDLPGSACRMDRPAGRRSLAGGGPVTPYAVLLAGYLGLLAVALLLEGYARIANGPFRPIATLLDAAWPRWPADAWCGQPGSGSDSTSWLVDDQLHPIKVPTGRAG
jgi:hypothetical protein